MLLVVSASVSSWFRNPVLGCRSMVAPACVAFRPRGVFGIWGPGVPAALAGKGLVIPIGPCLRGLPPYFLQLGARRRGSSVSDGLRRRLWRCVLSALVRVLGSVGGDVNFGVPGGGSGGFGHGGGAGVLVAERGSGMERGGGGQSDVKGPNGSGSSIACRDFLLSSLSV
ncbi:hypothetical protein Taro_044669 [Colocasia esculenta]|uniref:Uncharacterized protein n=1 Tax=Colocasia esculenta TaxID=4460 RepID=A0A843WPA5_COLES|nr:hypothetical protein [Colocasia esculenta]